MGEKWQPGRPFGRGEVIADFHLVRAFDHPPVFVIESPRGHQKGELLDYLRYSFSRRGAWYRAEDLDAKVDFFSVDPDPVSTFASVSDQLSSNGSWFRPRRFPRFRRVQALLASEQRSSPVPTTPVSAIENDLAWVASTGIRTVSTVTGTPVPVPSRRAGPVRWLRLLWWRVPLSRASRWAWRFERRLPGRMDGPNGLGKRLDMLQAGLAKAMAEDLTRMTRRRVLPVSEVACFIDGYQRVEASERPGFVVDFAKEIRRLEARVLLVVACREQERWTAYAKSQEDYEDHDVLKVSDAIQIHRLQPLGWSDRIYTLEKYKVPASVTREHDLATVSAGMPIALLLLGHALGDVEVTDPRVRSLCEKLPSPDRTDGDWFDDFSRTVAQDMIVGLDHDLERHLRAAATQRNFDAAILKALLAEDYSDKCYEQLVTGPFVGTPRPSSLLGVEKSYRVRSFARAVLTDDPSERTAAWRWHSLAVDHYAKRADRAAGTEAAFQLDVETLYHRLFIDPDEARTDLITSFQTQLLSGRTDRCEALLRIALDYDRTDLHWRATVLVNAGKMYLARDQPRLAEERLREAKQLEIVSLHNDDPSLAVTIMLALAKTLRVQDRLREAREEFIQLRGVPELHPVVEFQCRWTESVIAKSNGNLGSAADLALEATRLLEQLLEAPGAEDSVRAAESYGLGSLVRKRAHIVRHEADLARCEGDYVACIEKVEEARERYSFDPEPGIDGYNDLIVAHVLRHQGDLDGSFKLAEEIYGGFASRQPRDHRGAGRALRCMAQALLCGPEPERARPLLQQLVDTDPRLYPSARPFGLFGLGELARLGDDIAEARRLYHQSEEGTGHGRAHFERCYAHLGRIEIERIEAPGQVETEIRRLLDQPGVVEHPTLAFSAELLRVRALSGDEASVAAAGRVLERFVTPPGTGTWEGDVLERTLAAIAAGADLPPLVFNLP